MLSQSLPSCRSLLSRSLRWLGCLAAAGVPVTAQGPNHAVSLNGLDAYGTAAGVGGLYANSTWEAWIKLPQYDPNLVGPRHILFRWGMYSHSAPMVDASNGAVNALEPCGLGNQGTPGSLQPGQWHHVAVVFGTSQLQVFVDGAVVGTSPMGNCPYAGWETVLGARGYAGYDSFAKAHVDEARISNTTRYSGPFTPQARFTSDTYTVGLWHFDEGSGTTAFDSSPNARHFTLHGGFGWVPGSGALAPAFLPFGQGCAGTAGVPALSANNGSLPRLGTTFQMRLSNLPNGRVFLPLGFLGYSNTTAYGLQLPLSMGLYGMPPQCLQFVDPTNGYFYTLINGGGGADWDVPIPNNPLLQDSSVYVQAIVFDWSLPFALPAVATNAGEMVMRY